MNNNNKTYQCGHDLRDHPIHPAALEDRHSLDYLLVQSSLAGQEDLVVQIPDCQEVLPTEYTLWVSEQFLNGTSAHKRLFRVIEVVMEVKMNINNQ